MGYLESYSVEGPVHVLTLSEDKYLGGSKPLEDAIGELGQSTRKSPFMEAARSLQKHFHAKRCQLDPNHKPAVGNRENVEILAFMDLLEKRGEEEVRAVIDWSVDVKYWCSRLSTVSKLCKHFGEAIAELKVSKKGEGSLSNNRAYAEVLLKEAGDEHKAGRIEILSKHIEFCSAGQGKSYCIEYGDKRFREKLAEALTR